MIGTTTIYIFQWPSSCKVWRMWDATYIIGNPLNQGHDNINTIFKILQVLIGEEVIMLYSVEYLETKFGMMFLMLNPLFSMAQRQCYMIGWQLAKPVPYQLLTL